MKKNLLQATQLSKKGIADIFRLPCVTSIRKAWPNTVFATIQTATGKQLVREGDWICQDPKRGWISLTNKEYKQSIEKTE